VPNNAAFTITVGSSISPSSDPVTGDRIFRARSGDLLAIQLEKNPATDVQSVTYLLWDPSNQDAPLASRSAREGAMLTFTESASAQITPDDKQSTVHIQMPVSSSLPGAGTASWVLRAVAVTSNGTEIYDRGLALNAYPDAFREGVPAETFEFFQKGWETTLSSLVQNSFPMRRRYVGGSTSTIAAVNVAGITPTKSRNLIARATVWGKKTSAGDSIWKLETQAVVDSAGTVTASANAVVVTKSSGGTQVADTDFVPSIVAAGGQILVRLNQQQAGTYTYNVWLELLEQPL